MAKSLVLYPLQALLDIVLFFPLLLCNAVLHAYWRMQRREQRSRRGPTAFPPLTIDTVESEYARLRQAFDAGISRDIAWRRQQLFSLLDMLQDHEDDICAAAKRDLGKSAMEMRMQDIGLAHADIRYLAENIERLAAPKRIMTNLATFPNIRKEARGVVCVIGAWNYSIQLQLIPLAGAIAGGNCVIFKLSELAPAMGALLASLVPKYIDMRCVTLECQGGPDLVQAVLRQPIDMLFFTGSNRVGCILNETVAPRLIPAVLELGGKNPCFVDSTADMALVGRRVAWGKWSNAGQTCTAPDYVIVVDPEGTGGPVATAAWRAIRDAAVASYGKNPKEGQFCRIATQQAATRLARLIDGVRGSVVYGGDSDVEGRYVAPTIVLLQPDADTPLLRDEIFGPILPVVAVPSVDAAIALAKSKATPLSSCVFSRDSATVEMIAAGHRSGSINVNESFMNMSHTGLPFGGVGASGLGSYHGKYSFRAFTHERATVHSWSSSLLDVPLRYAPYWWFHSWVVYPLQKMFC